MVFPLTQGDVKQGRKGYKVPPVVCKAFPANRRLCVHTYLKEYLKRTLEIRKAEKQLFLTFRAPHKRATLNTISRWVKELLSEAGVDTGKYTAGSVRAASTSRGLKMGMPIDQVLKLGGWTRESTFQRFYSKTITKMDSEKVLLRTKRTTGGKSVDK